MEKLTRRQVDVLNYIKSYIVSHGYPPTVREIGKALDISSPATIHAHLNNLEKKGFIKIQLEGSKLIEKVFDKQEVSFYNGIAIDIFPLDGVNLSSLKSKFRIKLAFLLIRIQEGRFCSLSIRKGMKKVIAYLIKKLPLNDDSLAAYIEKLIQKDKYESAKQIANFYGHWKEKEIIDKQIFSTSTIYPFEDIYLKGVKDYNAYLTALYHNYMDLPPKEKQITHADEFYIQE